MAAAVSVDAQPSEISANVLPDGNVQIERNGPEMDSAHFGAWLLQMKKQHPKSVFHLYVRSEAAFEHENRAMEQIRAAGFKIAVD